jgi:uncharacterized protein YggE
MIPLALAALLTTATAAPTLAQMGPDPAFAATTLSLSASGEVKAAPDMASITLGVDTSAGSAAQAMSANAERMARVIAALKGAGVAENDLRTSALSLSPQTVYEEGHPPRLTGYQASNQLTVTVRDLARLGPVADAVVAAGATNVGSISFGLVDPLAAETSARLAAVKALQDKAALYARAAGYRVVRLVNLSEGAPDESGPRPMGPLMAMRAKAAPTPVEAGDLDIQVDVTGLFELGR